MSGALKRAGGSLDASSGAPAAYLAPDVCELGAPLARNEAPFAEQRNPSGSGELTGRSRLLRELMVVLLATAAVLWARWSLNPILNEDSPFSAFTLAVMVSSLYGGFRAGFGATLLSSALAWSLFLKPGHPVFAAELNHFVQLLLFVIIGLMISSVNEQWHRSKRRLRSHEEFLSNILEATPTGVLVIDTEGWVTFANSAAASLFGVGRALLVGRNYTGIGLSTGRQDNAQELVQALASGIALTPLRLQIESFDVPIEVSGTVTSLPHTENETRAVVLSMARLKPSSQT